MNGFRDPLGVFWWGQSRPSSSVWSKNCSSLKLLSFLLSPLCSRLWFTYMIWRQNLLLIFSGESTQRQISCLRKFCPSKVELFSHEFLDGHLIQDMSLFLGFKFLCPFWFFSFLLSKSFYKVVFSIYKLDLSFSAFCCNWARMDQYSKHISRIGVWFKFTEKHCEPLPVPCRGCNMYISLSEI